VNLLLDTAAFWWIASASSKLSARAAAAFADPANAVALSPISIWELLVKHQIGKFPTDRPIIELIAQAKNQRLIRPLPLVDSAVMRLLTLPDHHRDPFDRLLICQALDENMTLITPDEQIKAYPVPTLW
jgi:PIN domain nuclease of toxin-antitoxin system